MSQTSIKYHVVPASPEAHLFHVTLSVNLEHPQALVLRLPTWLPGSYMIREFSRNIVQIHAKQASQSLALKKISKDAWTISAPAGALEVHYEVYAYDRSVRTAFLDQTRGFFNPSSLCLAIEGFESFEHELEVDAPKGKAYQEWSIATSMKAKRLKKTGFGSFIADSYDDLIDHPFEMGVLDMLIFKAAGVAHDFVISGAHHNTDMKRLARDCKKICEYQISLFGTPAPFDHYVFMLYVSKSLYGGLEHRASTALMSYRDDLPVKGDPSTSDGYIRLLSLISHEYFHNWNVKRIKPAAYTPYDLSQEAYTRLLWAFEGITSYYDELVLLRCGLIDATKYLELLAKNITTVQKGNGRTKQNLEDASFDAWIKYYRPDENSPNALVSYYVKGGLMALALDLFIREQTKESKSLDDIMRKLWQNYLATGKGVEEAEWEMVAEEVTGMRLRAFFDMALRSTDDLPLETLLASHGIKMHLVAASKSTDMGGFSKGAPESCDRPVLGAKWSVEPAGVKLTHVLDGGAAQAAGLSALDVVVAIDGYKAIDLDAALARYKIGDVLTIHAFRLDELMTFKVTLKAAPKDVCYLTLKKSESNTWLADSN